MMNVHLVFRDAAYATSIFVALESLGSLGIPVWAIVVICATLPAVMLLASPLGPRALTAAKPILSICSCTTGKRLATMFANKGNFFANMKAAFLGYPFTLAQLGTKALWVVGLPSRRIGTRELLPTVVTDTRNSSSRSLSGLIGARARAILSVPVGFVKEDLATGKAGVLDAWNAYLETTEDTPALGRATLLVRNLVRTRPVSKRPVADRTNRGKCVLHHASDSMNRGSKRGAFLGMNACRQAATLPKPHVKYTIEQIFCKGDYYV